MMLRISNIYILPFIVILPTLVACEGSRDMLSVGTLTPPDEFVVVAKAPLVVPPDFGLRPPKPGAPRLQAMSTIAKGDQILAGDEEGAKTEALVGEKKSEGELALLAAANVEKAEPNIRSIIALETQQVSARGRSFAERIIFWQFPPGPNTPLNAAEEAVRLRGEGFTNLPPDSLQPEARRKRNLIGF